MAEDQTNAPALDTDLEGDALALAGDASPLAPLADLAEGAAAAPTTTPAAPLALVNASPRQPVHDGAQATASQLPPERLEAAHARGSIDKWDSETCNTLPLARLTRPEIEAELAAHPDHRAVQDAAAKAHTDAVAERDRVTLELNRRVHEAYHAQVAAQGSAGWGIERVRRLKIRLAEIEKAEAEARAKAEAEAKAKAALTQSPS